MRLYKPHIPSILNPEVDLDDPRTYSHLPQEVEQAEQAMLASIGWAIMYMDYIHPESFPLTSSQRIRINKMIAYFAANRRNNYNLLWMQEQLFLFNDEIENMC